MPSRISSAIRKPSFPAGRKKRVTVSEGSRARAAAGIVFQIFFVYRFKILATIAYVLMGWLAVFAVKPLLDALPAGGFAWILAGGIVYTVGALFYLIKSLPYNHAIWHLFVLGGSTCHYVAVLLYVVPATV